jgi:pyrimidine operon attenuation protein/uracil phosphoribosyltransferase
VKEAEVLSADDLARTVRRVAHEVIEGNPGLDDLVLVGIHTRGAVLAERLRGILTELSGSEAPLGELDISFYRDDLSVRDPSAQPVVHSTRLDFPLEGKTVVLIDDVLYTGRTVRSAIDALFDYGRPERIQLAVLCDRGHRELPIRPDYVGKNLPTSKVERVSVLLEETDGRDGVTVVSRVEAVE